MTVLGPFCNTYDVFQDNEIKIAEKIQQRRLQMLIHSCIYYEFNQNFITDCKWDEWARELVKLQNDNPEISEKVVWYDAFKDWDASTGAFLPLKDEWVVNKAKKLLFSNFKNLEPSNKPAATPKEADKKTGAFKLF